MSLKGVELQIAIPKTFDAGKMADARQQAIIQQQLHASDEANKATDKKRTQVIETENLDEIKDNEEQQASDQQAKDREKSNAEQDDEKLKAKAQHPFKGNFFDFSG